MLKRSRLVENIEQIKSMNFGLTDKVQILMCYQHEISSFEEIIAFLSAKRNVRVINNNFRNLSENGAFSVAKMWQVKKEFNFNIKDPPMAKMDKMDS